MHEPRDENLRRWIAEQLPGLLTEPLTLTELARLFGCNRDTMRKAIGRMTEAERFGKMWRLPVRKMPPAYFLERGLLIPARLPESAGF